MLTKQQGRLGRSPVGEPSASALASLLTELAGSDGRLMAHASDCGGVRVRIRCQQGQRADCEVSVWTAVWVGPGEGTAGSPCSPPRWGPRARCSSCRE